MSIDSSTGAIDLSASTPGSYTVTYATSGDCANSSDQLITVNPLPTAPTSASVDRNNICPNDPGNISLSVSGGSGTTLSWFTGSCGGTQVGTGNPLSIPSPTASITYYARWETSCGVTACQSIAVNVINTAPPTGASSQQFCSADAPRVSNLVATGTSIKWYSVASGGTSLSPSVLLSTGNYYASQTVDGCESISRLVVSVTINDNSVVPTATSNSPVCAGNTISLNAAPITGATYSWTGPDGFSSLLQNPFISNATAAKNGIYTVTATISGCENSSFTNVVVNTMPEPTASSNSPVCLGNSINLSAVLIPGATYSWSGPDGFTSTLQNPTIPNSTNAKAGSYIVTATLNGCSNFSTTNVIVSTAPEPTASSNSPVCEGGTINLFAVSITGASYVWNGPDGFTSTIQNPTIPDATASKNGTYTVTASAGTCVNSSSTNVTIASNPPTPIASSNSPVCEVERLELRVQNIPSASYSWIGPTGFNSNLQNPNIDNVTTANAGAYSVTATVGNCSSATTLNVSITEAPPPPTASSNSPVCTGDNIQLHAALIPGATYTWTGPEGFTSTLQNPSIPNATAAKAGTYSVSASVNGCTSNVSSTIVTIAPPPSNPTASSNSPVCEGNTINLTAVSISGASYTWTGPNGFTASVQNPSIPNATPARSGNYTVTASVGICTNSSTTAVVVNSNPTLIITNPASVNEPSTVNITVPAVTAGSSPGTLTYWTNAAATTSLPNPNAVPTTGTYYIKLTNTSGCISIRPVSVIVNRKPVSTGIPPLVVEEDQIVQDIDLYNYFTDPEDGNNLTFSIRNISVPGILNASISGNMLSIVLIENQFGTTSVTIRASDSGNAFIDDVMEIVVNPVNKPPTLDPIPDPAPILEDAAQQQITLTGISAGTNENQVLSFSVESSNAELLTISPIVYTQGAGTALLRYTPNLNQFGTSIITVIIDDGSLQNNEISRQFRVVVLPVADTPTVTDAHTNQNIQTTSGLVISRSVHDGNEVRYFKITNIQNGQLYLQNGITAVTNGDFITIAQGNAGLRFTPNSGLSGSFDVQASLENANSGLGGGVVTATIFINSIPTVQNLPSFLSVDEDSPEIHFDLFNYFDDVEDPDIDLVFTVSNSAPDIVSVQINGNILVISFLENQNGTAFITIRCTDTQGAFVEAVIQLLVNPVNDAPVFVSTPVISVDQDELYEYEIITSDVEGDAIYFDWIAPAWLWLTDNGDGTAVLFGTPTNEDVGEVDVKIVAIESISGLSTTQEFTINVINVNDTPRFVSTPPLEATETEKYEYVIEIVDPDPNDTYTVVIDLTTRPGWLVLTGGPNYILEGFPPVGSAGNYQIKLIVFDAGGAASEQEFTIKVSAPNNRPTITGNFSVTTDEDNPFTFVASEFEIRVQDPDPSDSLAFIVISELPSNGSLSVSGVPVDVNDTILVTDIDVMVYTPVADFFGSDYFEWKASDGKALSANQGRVNITIIPQDDPPRIINIETSPIVYVFGAFNVTITETAEVQEVDDGRIVSARFSIISNYNNRQDSLSIDQFDGIVTSWNDTTGVLSVTGIKNASVYQEIVRSLIYTNQNRFAPTTQTRTIQLTVFDGELESEPVTRNIQFEDTFVELFIPSGFTPNEDFANDTWQIDNIQEYDDTIVRVFSREGNMIFESIGQYREWDGRYNGKFVKSGVYYYTIEIQKYEKKYSGTITVLR